MKGWAGRGGLGWLVCGLPLLLLCACGEAPLPERELRSDDCLRDVQLDKLPEQIRRCDRVVARFPRNPAPLNERYLLLSLAGQDRKACADIRKAIELARSTSPGSVDPQLRLELKLRGELCSSPARQ
ncbi:MAG: hypothetical protein VKM97_04990 [Cyanobacteriota bacterium]|nr:hypothetical protein [Cyanobacteriota bacterium]